ncbi:MAG TPA: hypothetical protein VF170_02865 [Planctomycetaceae bacterium]
MYQLQFFDRNCRVIDAEDRIVFAGSFRECEEWLDLAENRLRREQAARAVVPRPSWLSRLQSLLLASSGPAAWDRPSVRAR